jgi:large subunit ribosomal protein L19e
MNLGKKKSLAVRTLDVGRARIVFLKSRLEDIKEAITKQDIRDLKADGAILVTEVCGRKKVEKRKRKRGVGKIKKKVNTRKRDYVIMTRSLRKYTEEMKKQGKISLDEKKDIRKKIRNKKFKSKANLRDYIVQINKSSTSSPSKGTSGTRGLKK